MRLLGYELRKVSGQNSNEFGAIQHEETRKRLAISVTAWGMLSVTVVSIAAIISASFAKDVSQTAMTVLTAVLPLIGTWVGTVLAYFFARENFDAASRASERLLSGRIDQPALGVARKLQEIQSMDIHGKNDDAILLSEIRLVLNKISKHRVPLMTDGQTKVRYVVHRQPLESFILNNQPSQFVAPQTLNDLLKSAEGSGIADSAAFIGENDTIAQAKAAMESRPGCQDVFITRDGTRNSAVLGWLTNNSLQRLLEP